MWRPLCILAKRAALVTIQNNVKPSIFTLRSLSGGSAISNFSQQPHHFFSPILQKTMLFYSNRPATLLQNQQTLIVQNRSVTKFSLKKGKRKTVKSVIKRFKRLNWGIWIRTRSGRNKKLFKKSKALKRRLRQHVFVNATQSWLLDKMVTNFWRRPKYYIDDPYEPYHEREEYFASRKKPLKY